MPLPFPTLQVCFSVIRKKKQTKCDTQDQKYDTKLFFFLLFCFRITVLSSAYACFTKPEMLKDKHKKIKRKRTLLYQRSHRENSSVLVCFSFCHQLIGWRAHKYHSRYKPKNWVNYKRRTTIGISFNTRKNQNKKQKKVFLKGRFIWLQKIATIKQIKKKEILSRTLPLLSFFFFSLFFLFLFLSEVYSMWRGIAAY